MAEGKAEIRGSGSFLDRLVVPRPITRLALVGLGGVAGALCWHFLPYKLLTWASGLLVPFCFFAVTAVWSMRDKADSSLVGEHLGAEAFKKNRAAALALRRRFMLRAAWVCVCTLVASSPLIASQLADAVWAWMMVVAGCAVGEAAYSCMLTNSWDEELRAARDRDLHHRLLRAEQATLLERIERTAPQSPDAFKGWGNAGETLTPVKPH